MGYSDSMNLYQGFNMNPGNFIDPMGLMWTTDNYEYNRWKAAQQAESESPVLRGVNAGLRTVSVGAMLVATSAASMPVGIASGSYILINGIGDNLNARLDAGQSWEDAKGGTIVDISTLGGYTVFTGRDAGAGDAVTVDAEDYGNFAGNVVVLVGGPKLYKTATTTVTEPSMIRINLLKPKFSGRLIDIQKTPNGFITVSESTVPESLLNGETNTHAYLGVRDQNPVYTGITKDPIKRAAQHGDRFELDVITETPITRRQARAIEQVLIEKNPQFENIINSIGRNRSWYRDAVYWGEKWLRENGFEWLIE